MADALRRPRTDALHQLTTLDVLNVANAAAGGSASGGTMTVERLALEEAPGLRRSRVRARLLQAGSFIYRALPHGIADNRLGIQWTCISFVCLIPLFIRPPRHWFWGPVWPSVGAFIGINAITTADIATGATNRNAYLRLLGTTLAAFFSFLVLIPMIAVGWDDYSSSPMVKWVLYYACVPTGFIWGFFIHHFPTEMHENFTLQGFGTQVYLYTFNSTKIIFDMMICTVGCYIGTVIGLTMYQLVFPARARDKLTHEISLITYKLSYSLELLINIESGVGRPNDDEDSSELLERQSKSKLRQWRALGRRGEVQRRGSRLLRSLSKRLRGTVVPDADEHAALDSVWSILRDCLKLMQRHDEIMKHARREHYWTEPHFFQYKAFKQVRADCTALYYHITSLFMTLEAQLTVATDTSARSALNLAQTTLAATQQGNDFGGLFNSVSQLAPAASAAASGGFAGASAATSGAAPGAAPGAASGGASGAALGAALGVGLSAAPGGAALGVVSSRSLYTPVDAIATAKQAALQGAPQPKEESMHRAVSLPNLWHNGAADGSVEPLRKALTWASLSMPPLATSAPSELIVAPQAASSQNTREDLLDTLAVARDSILGGESRKVSFVEDAVSIPVTPAPSSPEMASVRTQSPRLIPVGGELEILVNAPGEDVEPSAPAAQVIAFAPVVRWATVFGPLVSDAAKSMSKLLELIGRSLDTSRWDDAVWPALTLVEQSLAHLTERRREWWKSSEHIASLITEDLSETTASKIHCTRYADFEEQFCIPWLGLSLNAYGLLPTSVKDDLWIAFENMQDRQGVVMLTCVALLQRLRDFAENAEKYLSLQYPTVQNAKVNEKHELSRRQSKLEHQKNITR